MREELIMSKMLIHSDKPKVMIINSDGEYKFMESNKGAEAVIIATFDILRQIYPHAKIGTTVKMSKELSDKCGCIFTVNPPFLVKTYSPQTAVRSSINLCLAFAWNTIYTVFGADMKLLKCTEKLKTYSDSDIIIHIGMDLYSDDFGNRTVIEHSKDILTGALLGKPVVMWAESLGPFRKSLTKHLVKYTLNHVSLITIREELSRKYLEEIGISHIPVHVTADPAFLLQPCDPVRVNQILQEIDVDPQGKPIIGLSFSQSYLAGGVKKTRKLKLINDLSAFLQYVLPEKYYFKLLSQGRSTQEYAKTRQNYVKELALVADFLAEQYNAIVLLIPHIIHPIVGEEDFHREIFEIARNKNKIRILEGNYSASERKGLIGICDLFVGGRMHANIAALSQGVPSIGLAYSYKFEGIMALLGQEKYVINEIASQKIIEKINDLWDNKDSIRVQINQNIEKVKVLAFQNGVYLLDIIK